MKEIASIASNLLLMPLDNGQVQAAAELVIMTTEPEYGLDESTIRKSRPLEATRIMVTLQAVGGLIKSLHALGEEMEKMQAEYNAKLPTKPTAKDALIYYVSKNSAGMFELWSDESPTQHAGLGSFATVKDAAFALAQRHPKWLIEGPEPLKGCDTAIVVFRVTPQ